MIIRHFLLVSTDLAEPGVYLLGFFVLSHVAEEVYFGKGITGENIWDNATTRNLRPVSLSLVAFKAHAKITFIDNLKTT